MNENIKNYVWELLQDINLNDYMDVNELQILKDGYLEAIESDEIDDWYEFASYAETQGSYFFDEFEKAIQETIDSKMIYNSDCVELLQINLLDSFDILNEIMYDNPEFADSFEARSFAIHICDYVVWNWLRTELETKFISNAVNQLK